MEKPEKYLSPYLAGLVLGVVLFLAFLSTGNGLGASGGMNRVLVFIEDKIVPDHVDRVSFLAKMAGGDKNPLDKWTVFMLAGTLLGGFISGLFHKRLKIEIRKGPQISNLTRLILAFGGGAIMGYGARFARGCTSGQALSGGAVLSVGSWAFMFSVFISAYALAWFLRKIWN